MDRLAWLWALGIAATSLLPPGGIAGVLMGVRRFIGDGLKAPTSAYTCILLGIVQLALFVVVVWFLILRSQNDR